MACCVLAALVIANLIETWRRVKGLMGAPVRTAVSGAQHILRVRRMLGRPLLKTLFVIALSIETAGATGWFIAEHRDHLMEVIHTVETWVGMQVEPVARICRSGSSSGSR